MSSTLETQHAARVLGVVRGGADLVARGAVGADIAASWRRCMLDYSLDLGDGPIEEYVLDQYSLREHRGRHEELIQIASAEIDWLFDHMALSGSALVLTDAAGILLYERVDPRVIDEVRRAGLRVGADWSESRQGTNGMGTCLAERRPVIVHREEHYRSRLIGLSCTAAPIHDGNGELVAALDVTTLNTAGTRDSQAHMLSLVHMSAKLIEKCLFLRHFQGGRVLRFHARREFVNLQHDGALALGGDATIIAADEMALRLLGVDHRQNLIGRRIDEVFDVRAEAIGAALGSGNLWSIRDALVGRRFFASMSQGSAVANVATQFGRDKTAAPIKPLAPAAKERLSLVDLAGNDPAMQRNARSVRRIAASNVSVMIQGATGTGKEMLARALHDESGRAPFVALNCAAIPESLIESELFGYKAGAFTGARRDGAKGIILQSSGGTLFLDEIGDMPLLLQTRLLRVLEECEVWPLGAERAIKVDLRVVCASHQNLRGMIAKGQFREDLYYRLNGFGVELPTLAARLDKDELIRSMIAAGSDDGAHLSIDADAFDALSAYPWPGNIRELRNVVRTAAAICEAGVIRTMDLPSEVRVQKLPAEGHAPKPELKPIEAAERHALLDAIRDTNGNMKRAAALLRISRSSLYRRCKDLQISVSDRPPRH